MVAAALTASTSACVAGLLWADARGRRAAKAALKAAASAGFLALGLLAGAGGRYTAFLVAGLGLSVAGDLALLGRSRPAFVAGLVAFLLAHVAYATAFAPASHPSPLAAAAVTLAGAGVLRWLWPHLGGLRIPVAAYTLAISAMLLLALGVASPLARLGAALFYASDLTVARDQFVRPGFANRAVGLPLYYAGQVLLALSTAAPP